MKIVKPTLDITAQVAANMRDSDVAEFMAVSWFGDEDALKQHLAHAYAHFPHAYAALGPAGEPIAVGAVISSRPNVCTLGFFATDALPEIGTGLTRFVRNRLLPQLQQKGAHRIECISIDGHSDAHRWIRLLGMEHEATLPRYGRNGETYHQFAWTDAGTAGAIH